MNKIDLCREYDIDKKIRDYEESIKLLELTINKYTDNKVKRLIKKIIG